MFSEVGYFEKMSYPVWEGFNSLSSFILLIQIRQRAYCHKSRHGQFFAKQAISAKEDKLMWSVLDAQQHLGKGTLLPREIVSLMAGF